MKNMTRYFLIVIMSTALIAMAGCGLLPAAEPIPTLASTIDLPPQPTAAPVEPTAAVEDTQALEETAAPEDTPEPDDSGLTETGEPTLPAADLPPYPGPGDDEAEGGIAAGDLSGLESTPITLPGPVERVAWPSPDVIDLEGSEVALLQSGGEFLPVLLDPPTLAEPISIPADGSRVIALAPDASSLVIQNDNQTAVFTLGDQQLQVLPQPAQASAANYSEDSRYLVVSSIDQIQATIYDLEENATAQIDGFTTAAPVYNTFIAPGGQTAAWVSRATLQFHDVASNTLGQRLDAPDFISTIAFSPDGQRLALSAGTSLEIYSVPSGEQLAQVTLSEPARSLDFSPDGQILLSDYRSGLQSWDAETLAPLSAVSSESSAVTLVSFSPGGDTIISLHDDNTLRVWKARE